MRTPGDCPDPPTRQGPLPHKGQQGTGPALCKPQKAKWPLEARPGPQTSGSCQPTSQSTLMPLALGMLPSGCRRRSGGAEDSMSLQEQGQGPGCGRNAMLSGQGPAEKAAFTWAL